MTMVKSVLGATTMKFSSHLPPVAAKSKYELHHTAATALMCQIAETRRIPITSPLGRNCDGNDSGNDNNKKRSGNGNDKKRNNRGHGVCVCFMCGW